MAVVLYGYQYSVYAWIARLALAEKGVAYDYIEVNPFAADVPAGYLRLHPFQRVPALVHDDFAVYETVAITWYIDESFDGPALQPAGYGLRARMAQIISIIDSYGYRPMVRQVFSHGVFGPRVGRSVNGDEVRAGLDASARVICALEALAEPGGFLTGDRLSLADLHLAPMLAYFTAAAEGQAMVAQHPKLSAWQEVMRRRASFIATDPGLPCPI